jgi:replicative DNA helicase
MSILLQHVLPPLLDAVLHDEQPARFVCGKGTLGKIRIQPGRVTAFGAPPGTGKTALITQMTMDGLTSTPDLVACVCNVEMPPAELAERMLARLSGVNLSRIMDRTTTEADKVAIRKAAGQLAELERRIVFVRPPFTVANVYHTAKEHGAKLVTMDYIQRIPPTENNDKDARTTMNDTMHLVREMADEGRAVLVVSAVNRGSNGDYSNPGLGSFRESSEIEFGTNDAFILSRDKVTTNGITLTHCKNRNEKLDPINLTFDGSTQRFETVRGEAW